MSARDDYDVRPDGTAWTVDDWPAIADEIDRLRAWKESAMVQLSAWDDVWEAAGKPGPLGSSKAANVLLAIKATR